MYDVIELSRYILQKCIDENSPLTNLQLQKILYFIQKGYMKKNKLAFRDFFEAWQFGPVISKVYYMYSSSGGMPITMLFPPLDEKTKTLAKTDTIVNSIVKEKREANPWDLVADTHRPGGAWEKTFANGIGLRSTIDNKLIEKE